MTIHITSNLWELFFLYIMSNDTNKSVNYIYTIFIMKPTCALQFIIFITKVYDDGIILLSRNRIYYNNTAVKRDYYFFFRIRRREYCLGDSP